MTDITHKLACFVCDDSFIRVIKNTFIVILLRITELYKSRTRNNKPKVSLYMLFIKLSDMNCVAVQPYVIPNSMYDFQNVDNLMKCSTSIILYSVHRVSFMSVLFT